MSVESGIESSPNASRSYMYNRAFGNKRYIIGGIVLFAVIGCAWIFSPTSGGSNDGTTVAGPMSWPPPEVQEFDSFDDIDTNRERILLRNLNDIVTDKTILQKMEMQVDEEIEGILMETVTKMENEMIATDLSEGIKKIDTTLTHYFSSIKTFSPDGELVNEFEYDSDNDDGEGIPGIDLIGKVIGHNLSIEVDENGNVIHASENEELLKAFSGENGKTLSPDSQFEQMNRMTKMMPTDPVRPGDEWDFEMEMEQKFGGTAVLLGYKQYDNSDCAVINLKGVVNISKEQLDAMGNAMAGFADDDELKSQMGDVFDGMNIKNGAMSAIMYWDRQYNIARFQHATIQMDITMPDPTDPTKEYVVPVNETLVTYSSIME